MDGIQHLVSYRTVPCCERMEESTESGIMNPINFCGGVALMVACAIVLIAVLLVALLGFCLVLGAADSVSNPHASDDARAEYQNVTVEISAGTAGLNQAVRNVTGGG